jgi:hypothetical protein
VGKFSKVFSEFFKRNARTCVDFQIGKKIKKTKITTGLLLFFGRWDFQEAGCERVTSMKIPIADGGRNKKENILLATSRTKVGPAASSVRFHTGQELNTNLY